MLDATERKTLAWCMFGAGVLCLIPGEIPKGPALLDYVRQVVGRLLDHHATHGAWGICMLMVAHHLWRLRKEQTETQTETQTESQTETPVQSQG
jgi:hypothetical protein